MHPVSLLWSGPPRKVGQNSNELVHCDISDANNYSSRPNSAVFDKESD